MDKSKLKLIYVNPIGVNSLGLNEYEFFFSEDPDSVWAKDWNICSPSACKDLIPEPDMYQDIERLVTDIPLFCAQENSCFSMQDVQDGILSLIFEDISNYENFPEPYRIVLYYGDDYDKVVKTLQGREQFFVEDENNSEE